MLAFEHFTQLELRHRLAMPSKAPNWDWESLKKTHDRKELPDNLRDLRSFVISVLQNRVVSRLPWRSVIGGSEIAQAIAASRVAACDVPTKDESSECTVGEFRRDLLALLGPRFPERMKEASEDEIEDLVFYAKRLALQISERYAEGVVTTGNRVYKGEGTDKTVWKELVRNPQRLHPNKRKRSRPRSTRTSREASY